MQDIIPQRGAWLTKVSESVLAILLMAVVSGCHPKAASLALPPEPMVDSQLRSLMGVHTLRGSCPLPPDRTAYLLTWLEIEDGKLLRTGAISSDGPNREKRRKIDAELLWGEVNGTMKTALDTPGGIAVGSSESGFWRAFEGGSGSHNYTKGEVNPTFEGYTILAFVTSDQTRDGTIKASYSMDFSFEVKEKKYVGALALKCFQTQAELDQSLKGFTTK